MRSVRTLWHIVVVLAFVLALFAPAAPATGSHTSRGTNHSQWPFFATQWRGDYNDLVALGQAQLNRFGYFAHLGPYGCSTSYAGAVDGYYDWCTEAAVDLFMRHHIGYEPGVYSWNPRSMDSTFWGLLQGRKDYHEHATLFDSCHAGTVADSRTCEYEDRHNHHPRPYEQYVHVSKSGSTGPYYYYFLHYGKDCWVMVRQNASGTRCYW